MPDSTYNPFEAVDEFDDEELAASLAEAAKCRKIEQAVVDCTYKKVIGNTSKCFFPTRTNNPVGGPRVCLRVRCPIITAEYGIYPG